jgi:hypothetical protein
VCPGLPESLYVSPKDVSRAVPLNHRDVYPDGRLIGARESDLTFFNLYHNVGKGRAAPRVLQPALPSVRHRVGDLKAACATLGGRYLRHCLADNGKPPDTLITSPFSLLSDIINHESLRLESEDGLYDFISKGIETNGEMFGLLEYCSVDVMKDFLDILSEHFYLINASIWPSVRARLVLPNRIGKQFPPSMKKDTFFDLPDRIIAHLTRECGGNVHDRHVVDVTSVSFEKETQRAYYAVKNAAHISFRLFARKKKIFRTLGTIGYATTSRRGGLCQLTTQSACRIVIRPART